MVKRREPTGGRQERGQGTRLKEDTASIQEHTLRLLRAGARASAASDHSNGAPNGSTGTHHQNIASGSRDPSVGSMGTPALSHGPNGAGTAVSETGAMDIDVSDWRCGECGDPGETFCTHCEQRLCCGRERTCESCQEPFCEQCSVTNYDERYDRVFCLECNETHSRRASGSPSRSQLSQRGFKSEDISRYYRPTRT
ncbi:hypothetical protein KFL_000900250 [Klebsormidium nitens]|uniref:Uncharacterized protein n=1 Tax=Klebsormidium nitens TaxID=105231 RepID=A0A0U9HUE6_KLENI|nr:hypothetical protein KFL_000900250 [Klebsormidium nitens]|eukprot:GAQ81769.1 hypothetical protein KFL_000900250 [Klebsormidium nitens]